MCLCAHVCLPLCACPCVYVCVCVGVGVCGGQKTILRVSFYLSPCLSLLCHLVHQANWHLSFWNSPVSLSCLLSPIFLKVCYGY